MRLQGQTGLETHIVQASDSLIIPLQSCIKVVRLTDVKAVEIRFRGKVVRPDNRPKFPTTACTFRDGFPDIPGTFRCQGVSQGDSAYTAMARTVTLFRVERESSFVRAIIGNAVTAEVVNILFRLDKARDRLDI
jgi:hypothetical protein